MSDFSFIASSDLAYSSREEWLGQIARLPLTMQPALNHQVSTWNDLFPFEQKRAADFLHALSLFHSSELEALTRNLRELEQKMDVTHWGFSISSDTMKNASQLARSPYYLEWRREVQRVFSAIDSRSSAETGTVASRLLLLILPDSLPMASLTSQKTWDPRGAEYAIDGDVHRIAELALQPGVGLPALISSSAASTAADTDCWLIDAEAHLQSLYKPLAEPATLVEYGVLKTFKDQFLSQVNTVPKDIEGTDQILARMRRQDWNQWWPKSMAGQDRLRSFVVELFLSGNGALIFSNSFVQWAASEALRRARPRLLVARFGMRSKPKPFTGIAIFENQQKISALRDTDDPEGSAADALILARYVWLSALRYPEAQQTSCICVGESSRSIYVIAPDAKRPAWAAGTAVTPNRSLAGCGTRSLDRAASPPSTNPHLRLESRVVPVPSLRATSRA